MTRWAIGTNDYYFTSSIILEEAPWYIFFIEYIIDCICAYFPRIPLPKIKIKRDGEEYTLKKYYGSTADLFHIYVCIPINNWCYKHIKCDQIHFPYLMLQEKFPEKFPESDLFIEEEVVDNKIESKLIEEEFKIVYEKLKNLTLEKLNIN